MLLDGREAMAVDPGGTIFLVPETAENQPVVDAYDIVAGISAQVREYTKAMAAALPLAADGLHNPCYLRNRPCAVRRHCE